MSVIYRVAGSQLRCSKLWPCALTFGHAALMRSSAFPLRGRAVWYQLKAGLNVETVSSRNESIPSKKEVMSSARSESLETDDEPIAVNLLLAR